MRKIVRLIISYKNNHSVSATDEIGYLCQLNNEVVRQQGYHYKKGICDIVIEFDICKIMSEENCTALLNRIKKFFSNDKINTLGIRTVRVYILDIANIKTWRKKAKT